MALALAWYWWATIITAVPVAVVMFFVLAFAWTRGQSGEKFNKEGRPPGPTRNSQF
jgi:hypothetical protein